MFVYNFKLDKKIINKCLIGFGILIVVIIISIFCYNSIKSNSTFKVEDSVITNEIQEIASQNYTNVLRSVYENPDIYVGQKIRFSGFVHRIYDFKNNQFVLARNMIIDNNNQTVIVGFLCESKEIADIPDNTWIEIEGEIQKTNYHGETPVVKVTKLTKIAKPDTDEFVYPPEDTYIPTSAIY